MFFGFRADQPAGELHGGQHAAVIGLVLASDFEGGAVIGRRADDRQTERDVNAGFKRDLFERDQALIVVGADDRIEGLLLHGVIKNRVRRQMAHDDFFFPQLFARRNNDAQVFVAEETVFAHVRINSRNGKARFFNPGFIATGPYEPAALRPFMSTADRGSENSR